MELLRQILVAAVIEHRQPCHKRNIRDSEVYTAVGYARLLETLYIHLRVRVKQRQYPASRRVHLHGVDSAAVAHIRRHQPQDIADTRRAFEHIATLETQRPRNIPHRVYHRRRCVIRRTPALNGRLIPLFTQQLAQPLSRRIPVRPLVESFAKTAPAAELAQYSHLLRSSSLPALKQTTRQLYRLDVRLYARILSLRSIIGAALGTVVTPVLALALRKTIRYRDARRWFRYASASLLVRHRMADITSTHSSYVSSLSFIPLARSQRFIRFRFVSSCSSGNAGASLYVTSSSFISLLFFWSFIIQPREQIAHGRFRLQSYIFFTVFHTFPAGNLAGRLFHSLLTRRLALLLSLPRHTLGLPENTPGAPLVLLYPFPFFLYHLALRLLRSLPGFIFSRAHLSLAENISPRPVEILDVETVYLLARSISLAAVTRHTLSTLVPRLHERLHLRTQSSRHSLRKILEPRNAVIQEIERIVHTQAEHHTLLRRRHPVRVAETLAAVPLVIADTQQLPELLLLSPHLLRNLETTLRLIRSLRRSHRLRMVSKRSLARTAELAHQTLRVHAVNRPLRPLAAAPAFPRRLEIIPLQHSRGRRFIRPVRFIGITFPAIRLHISRQSITFAPGNV